jgi:hypothetical protein
LYTGLLCWLFRFLAADFLAAFFVVFVTAFFADAFLQVSLSETQFATVRASIRDGGRQ